MLFAIYDYKSVLGCYDYSRLCHIVSKFHELFPNVLNYGLTFTISTNQRVIEWRDSYIPGFEMYYNKTHRNTYVK